MAGNKNKKNTRNPQSLLFRRLTRLLSGPLTIQNAKQPQTKKNRVR